METGLRRDGREVEGRAEGARTGVGRDVRLGPMDGVGRLRRIQTAQGGFPHQQHRPERAPLHGFGGRRLHPHLRHRRADGLLRRHRECRRVRAMGCEHGGDAPHPVEPRDRSPPVQGRHRSACAVDLRTPLVRTVRQRHDLRAEHGSRHPQLHLSSHHLDRCGESGFRQQACELQTWRDRHRLWAASESPTRSECDQQRLSRRGRQAQGKSGQVRGHELRGVCRVRVRVHAREGVGAVRCARRAPAAHGPGLRRSAQEGDLVLDHGRQSAHPRHLGEQHDLQRAPAARQDLGARQQPVLADRPALGLRYGT